MNRIAAVLLGLALLATGSFAQESSVRGLCGEVKLKVGTTVFAGRNVTCLVHETSAAGVPGGVFMDNLWPPNFTDGDVIRVNAGATVLLDEPFPQAKYSIGVLPRHAPAPSNPLFEFKLTGASPEWKVDVPRGEYIVTVEMTLPEVSAIRAFVLLVEDPR